MKIKPFGFNILVKPVEQKQVLVSDKKSLHEYGEVIAIGSEVKEIKVGDMIGFSVFGLKSLDINDEKFFFVPEASEFILGRVELE